MTTAARVLIPLRIGASDIKAGTTIAEPDTGRGEVAWVASGSYTAGQARTYSGSVYECVKDHSGSAVTPDADAVNWLRKGPSNRMAPFDDYANTKARADISLAYVLQPGFFTAVKLYGCEGETYSIVVKDAPGGEVIREKSGGLWGQAMGFWELLFAPLLTIEEVGLDDIPIAPNAEATITISAGSGPVALGTIKLGDWYSLVGGGDWGGAEYGAKGQRKTYSYRKYNDDGTYTTVARASYREIRCTVKLPSDEALYADAVLGRIADVAVPFEASGLPRYGYLNTLGFVSGDITADAWGIASLALEVKGNI